MSEPNGRVTNSQLYQALDERTKLIAAEQKTEHLKTRLIVIGMGVFSGGAKLLTLAGVITLPHLP